MIGLMCLNKSLFQEQQYITFGRLHDSYIHDVKKGNTTLVPVATIIFLDISNLY